MHAQYEPCALVDCVFVVFNTGSVSGSNLAKYGAALRHYIGDSKAAADLDQLTSRDDHLAALRQCVQHKQDRGCVVIRYNGRFTSGKPAYQVLTMRFAPAALASSQIIFEIRVARCRFRERFQRLTSKRRAPKIGVDNYTGCIDDASKRRLRKPGNSR